MAMLTNFLWKTFFSDKKDLIQVSGSLYEFDREWRCLFNNCEVTIIRTDTQYTYKMQVVRVLEEGEDYDQDAKHSYEFLIDDAMNLTKEPGVISDYAFSWTDTSSSTKFYKRRFLFEFDAEKSGNVQHLAHTFETTLCQCMYERRYQTNHTEASEEDLEQFMRNESSTAPFATPAKPSVSQPSLATTTTTTPTSSSKTSKTPVNSNAFKTPEKGVSPAKALFTTPPSAAKQQQGKTVLTEPVTPMTYNQTPKSPQSTTNTTDTSNNNQVLALSYPLDEEYPSKAIVGDEVLTVEADLYLLNPFINQFEFKEPVLATIKATGNNKDVFSFNLILQSRNSNNNNNQLVHVQGISSEMFMTFYKEQHSVVWVYSMAHQTWTWSLVFQDEKQEDEFKKSLAERLWETNAGKPFGKLKKDESEWVHQLYDEDVIMEENDGVQEFDMMDFVEENEMEDAREKAREESEEEEEEQEEEEVLQDDSSDDDNDTDDDEQEAKNSLLSVGFKNDRSYVARGNKIGVFKHTPGDKLKFSTTINKLKTPAGKNFSPRKMMLHQEDHSMLFLAPGERQTIYRMDLNREDIVEEWKTGETNPVNDILPQTKYSELNNEQTLLGLNSQGFMLIDPRLPKEKVVNERSYTYKASTKPKLSCAATTATGQMAVGSATGEIRLFSAKTVAQPKKDFDAAPRAKTALPGFGDPIIGIDVSSDGKWVLATCKTYLLVIPTEINGDSTGFETPMGKQKPAPRRLQLTPQHVTQMGGNIHFTPARFNVGTDMERSIVTSTGKYVITWNFRKVKQGQSYEYQIKMYDDTIVGDQFIFGNDRSIVVATPNNVSMAKKAVRTFSPNSPIKHTPLKKH